MTFGEKVKKARINIGVSQTVLGEKIGVSLRTITSYESDVKKPRPATLSKLAEVLRVPINYLTDDSCTDPYDAIKRDSLIDDVQLTKSPEYLLGAIKDAFNDTELNDKQKEKLYRTITEAYFDYRENKK